MALAVSTVIDSWGRSRRLSLSRSSVSTHLDPLPLSARHSTTPLSSFFID